MVPAATFSEDDRRRPPRETAMRARLEAGERRSLLALFLLALALYGIGAWSGLPAATAPDRTRPWESDELGPLGPIGELHSVLHQSPRFNPQYPLFHYVVQALFVGPYVGFLWLNGDLSSPSVEYPYGLDDPETVLAVMTMLARVASLLMAAAVVVIARITATILWGRPTGRVAGLLVLVAFPMFFYSRVSRVDMGALFWTALGLAVFAACLRDRLTPRRALWLGVCAALAIATKDACYGAFALVALFLLVDELRAARRPGDHPRLKSLLIGLVSSVLVYLVASGAVFHPERFRQHVAFLVQPNHPDRYSFSGLLDMAQSYVSIADSTTENIVASLGLPTAVFATVGLISCAVRDRRMLAFLLPAIGIFLGAIAPVRLVLLRYVLIIAYVLAFFAARGLTVLTSSPRPTWRLAGQTAFFLAVGWSLLRGLDFTYQMIRDSRYTVAAWMAENARPGDRVGYFGRPDKLPRLAPGLVTVPMPGQKRYLVDPPADPSIEPEFVMVVAPPKGTHEWTMPEALYQRFMRGETHYELVLSERTRSLFNEQRIAAVNPVVKVFVRKDRVPGLRSRGPTRIGLLPALQSVPFRGRLPWKPQYEEGGCRDLDGAGPAAPGPRIGSCAGGKPALLDVPRRL